MRPIQLNMEAFGPYREAVHLDFRTFGHHSIFLINGPTGSGKTTIFDAISYALFNEASGQMRDTEMMKSDYATDSDFAFVELTFEMQNQIYRIIRSPKQKGPGERVDVRDYPSSVEFYREEEFLASGMEANEQIIDLIGLDYGQFRQIVLLPQGEFRQLLMSNSRDKEKIFRNIFGTESIQSFQEHLKTKKAYYQKEYKVFATRLEQSIENIEWDKPEVEEIKDYQELQKAIEQKDYDQLLEILDRLVKREKMELSQLAKQLKTLDEQIKSYQLLKDLLIEKSELMQNKKELVAGEASIDADRVSLQKHKEAKKVQLEDQQLQNMQKKCASLEQSLIEREKEAKVLHEKLESLNEDYDLAQKEVGKLDNLRAELSQINAEEKDLLDLEEKEKIIKQAEKNQKLLNEKIGKIKQEEEKLLTKIAHLNEQISHLTGWRQELEDKKSQEENLKNKIQGNQEKQESVEKVIKLKSQLTDSIQANQKQYKDYQDAERLYIQARQDYFNNLAGTLAKDLLENEACPVCGSKNHPAPATTKADYISQRQLEKLEEKRNKKRSTQEKTALAIDQIGAEIEYELSVLKAHDNRQLSKEKIQIEKNELASHIKKLKETLAHVQERIALLEENIQQETDWRKELEKEQGILEENRQQLVVVQKDYAIEERKTEENKETVKRMKKALSMQSLEQLKKDRKELKTDISRIENRTNTLQELFNEKRNEKTKVESIVLALTDQKEQLEEEIAEQIKKITELLEHYQLNEPFEHFLIAEKKRAIIEKSIANFEKEQDYTQRRLTKIKQQLENYTEESNQKIAEVKENLKQFKVKKEQVENQREQRIRQKAMLDNSYQAIRQNINKSKNVLGPLEIYSDLAEIANGSNKRTNYVSFERYLLSIYFTEVLNAANKRLIKMTNSRYELVRRQDKTKGRGAEGLEIDVFDGYSGKTRSVKSLSGGETFKASLALALGLSDVIQSQKGGIEINTLFIDEGFGSLDVDSLEMAIETLMDLQASGRLIGIISHVAELKDRIPARIIVEKVKEGSQAHIERD